MADEPEEVDPKELRQDLIKSLKLTRKQFFAFVPKGSLGQLVVRVDKADRDREAESTKREIGGGTPVKGICEGGVRDKLFTLDKRYAYPDKLAATLKIVIKRSTGLAVNPTVKIKGAPDEDDKD
jgi:hypothetical protein